MEERPARTFASIILARQRHQNHFPQNSPPYPSYEELLGDPSMSFPRRDELFMGTLTTLADLERLWRGNREVLAGPLEVSQASAESSRNNQEPPGPAQATIEELSTTSSGVSSKEDQDDETGHPGTSKRRQRTHTERRQVLNRLAQQRYRLRKKEKAHALQSTVGTLRSQLDCLALLDTLHAP